MRFEALFLERYGAFTHRTLEFRADAHLHVVLGANEAGKTSALCAITDLLFGFRHNTNYDFLHSAATLRIGARVRLADQSSILFYRRKGRTNTLVDAADKPLGEDSLDRWLGAVSREAFQNDFGLTAETLRKGGQDLLRAGGRLAETLAAASAGLAALTRVRARLDEEADCLFSPRRAASRPFYVADDKYSEASRRLRESIITVEALRAAHKAAQEAKEQCALLQTEQIAAERGLEKRRRAKRTRATLRRLDDLREEWNSFSDLPTDIQNDARLRWREALAELAQIGKTLADLDIAAAESEAAISALALDEKLLAAGLKIDSLRERLGAIRKAKEDLPRRREAQRAASEMMENAARRLGLASRESLLARLPSELALARIRDLTRQLHLADERLQDATARLAAARREAERLQTEARAAAPMDPEPLRRRFDVFFDIPADAERLRRENAACAAEEKRLSEDAATFDPPAESLEALARAPLPDESHIEAARRLFEEINGEEKRAQADLEAEREALAATEADIAALARSGQKTRDDLAAVRLQRDQALAELGDRLDQEAGMRRAAFAAVREKTRLVDEMSDLILLDAERAARLGALREKAVKGRRDLDRLAARREEIEKRRGGATDAWRQLWAPAGVNPAEPSKMARWRERLLAILTQRRRLEEKRIEAKALADKLAARRPAVMNLLEELGSATDPSLPVEALHAGASAAIERLQAAWTQTREGAAAGKSAAEAVLREEKALADLQKERQNLRAPWIAAIEAIGQQDAALPAEVDCALAIWAEVPAHKQAFEREGRSVDGIMRDIAEFDGDVAQLVAAAAPDLSDRPAEEALAELTRRIAAARRADDEFGRLKNEKAERAAKRASLDEKREQVRNVLAKARERVGLPAEAPLEPVLQRLERRTSLKEELKKLTSDLAEISDGQHEDGLRAEQTDLEPDLLEGDIERLETRHQQLAADFKEASIRQHEAEKAYEAIQKGRDAEGAARAKTEAAAEIIAIAERWLARAAAARLATRAIERHRSTVQDPLLERAATLFTKATAGAFAGLGVDYDESDRPVLVGLRPSGAKVAVAGLSEGARDQLFLALRLALLELRAAEPPPFIGDDLLASFDEERVARALAILAEFGRKRQAILFTHHKHVAEIARAQLGADADVITL